ncbi:respiratory nitrate reductase subunit gamma [Adlercreutzia sp. ZJ473]|uniref:respiratory nitrate reductase subunit gamma n=1 Tax=Adlercreutzia sp. ZJ473 TaxID=2722822 RepID=UPI0015577430|nr:respiratory nitrate reductase subunit gamma [Adlercreutzia sp. ZJ473]
MDGATLVSVLLLAALAGFLVLSALKFWKYSRLSTHGRFDLYPVPKEGADKVRYGGSYFEESEWWAKERTTSLSTEVVEIMKEMFFIKTLFERQRSLWWASFLFHAGVYVLFGWSVLLILGAFVRADFVIAVINVVGELGFAFAAVGTVLLLVRRLTDEASRVYMAPADYFNLVLILAVLVTGIASWTTGANVYDVAAQVLTLSVVELPALVMVHFVLLGVMMVYIPVSKMGHYAGKFFSFHRVLWDNDPNLPGSKVERNMRAAAAAPAQTAWSAPHTRPTQTDPSASEE